MNEYELAVLGGGVMLAPCGVTEAAGFTTVSFHLPVADAPVGLVDVTVIWTVPAPALPVVNVAVIVVCWPAIMIPPIAGHVVTAVTEPVFVQLVEYRVSTSPVFVTVKET